MIAKIEDKNRRTEQIKNKRSPFGLQKDSFYMPKGLHLHSKRTPFESQKESFLKEGGKSPTPNPSPAGRGVI